MSSTGAYPQDRAGLILKVEQESPSLLEIGSDKIYAVAFTANGEYLVGSGEDKVRVWRLEDGKEVVTMKASVLCLAVSKNGRWIAAGSIGGVIVWDAQTYEKVFETPNNFYAIAGVDFSPDSTQLVVASFDSTAAIWTIAAGERVLTLPHDQWVRAAKYSPKGDQIATATYDSVRLWDNNDGRLLVDIPVTVIPRFNTGLLWFRNSQLLVISHGMIKQFDSFTGSTLSEWPVPDSHRFSCIALSKDDTFIVYTTKRTVTFWDTSTHTQLNLTSNPQDIYSIALSPDDQFLAISKDGGGIEINCR